MSLCHLYLLPCEQHLQSFAFNRNLYYFEYLKDHAAVTSAAFEIHWKGLSKDIKKHWGEVSKSKKAGSTDVENGEDPIDN